VPSTLNYELGSGSKFRDSFSYQSTAGCTIAGFLWKIDYDDGAGYVAPLPIHDSLLSFVFDSTSSGALSRYLVSAEASGNFFDPTKVDYPDYHSWAFQIEVVSDANTILGALTTEIRMVNPCRNVDFSSGNAIPDT
jgi:hypothetical protein